MEFVSFIANSGIQIVDLKINLDSETMRKQKFTYMEDVDSTTLNFWFEELIELKQLGQFIQKSALNNLGIQFEKINDPENIERIEESKYFLFSDGEEKVFSIRNAIKTLKKFEKKWIPMPFFKSNNINTNHFGPVDWVRVYYELNEDNSSINIAISVDTSTSNDENQNHSPVVSSNPNENRYRLCSNEDLTMSYMSELTQCEWVSEWLKSFFTIDNHGSQTEHMATYIHFLRILNSSKQIPYIQLLTDECEIIDLDLSIDVGNSHTCAILFETPLEGELNFTKVKKLKIRNLSNPLKSYSDAFSTRIVFADENFGMKDSFFAPHHKFMWPSMVRIGFEAEELIHSVEMHQKLHSEDKFFNSSPKRYLWDSKPSKIPWKFYEKETNLKNVYKRGISEQLKSDGAYCTDDAFGAMPLYSRKTLMTFLFLEIFSQALSQFNSFEFRSLHGSPNSKRRLRNVVISCPTGMSKVEQIALRQCADEAVKILTNYWQKLNLNNTISNPPISERFDIIPRLADLRKNLDDPIEEKVDWMYDEATCSQFVYLYGLIQHKFDGDPTDLFKIFGHKNDNNKQVITIGSLDIGGGTSDLLISEYELKFKNSTELKPNPLYHEGFHLAGDDLLKNIIQNIVVEGYEVDEEDHMCTGVIFNHGSRLHGAHEITDKINGFFGKDAAGMDYLAQMMRVNFINQIGIPIALQYMEIANEQEVKELGFEELFIDKKPSNDLLDYFEKHFGFRFEDLRWKLNPKKVNKVIVETFSKLIKQVAKIMHLYKCDFVLISGRPSNFKAIEKLFLEIHPVQPNRFVNLNNYWIGKWYPFSDNNGYIKDPKTIVSTGALIGLMATKFFKLKNFKINSELLKEKLISTANYIGQIQDNIIKTSFITPSNNISDIDVYSLPHSIGIKHNSSSNYPSRNLYQIQYNEVFIRNIAKTRYSNRKTGTLESMYQNIINEKNSKLPFTFKISREIDIDKEKLFIEEVIDSEGESLSNNMFVLKLITLPKENGYWFDTAEFTLSINTKH